MSMQKRGYNNFQQQSSLRFKLNTEMHFASIFYIHVSMNYFINTYVLIKIVQMLL